MAQIKPFKIITPKRIRSFLTKKSAPPMPLSLEVKRKAIFNPELKELVDQVASPKSEDLPLSVSALTSATTSQVTNPPTGDSQSGNSWESLDRNIPPSNSNARANFSQFIPPEKIQEQNLLSAVYIPQKNIQESAIMDYTSFVLERMGIEFFSWHFLAYDSNAYFSEMSSGIDIITRKNFLFLKTDPFIKRLTPNFFELKITHELMKDPFFNKKFSVESLSLYSNIYFFFQDEPEVDACLVAFIERNKSESASIPIEMEPGNRWLTMVQDKIKVLSPALKRYRVERLSPRISEDDMLTSSLHHFKAIIGEGLETFHVHKIKLLNYKALPNHYFLKKQFISQLLQRMGSREKIIELGLNTYLVLAEKDLSAHLREKSEEDGIDLTITHKVYPQYGENYLSYL